MTDEAEKAFDAKIDAIVEAMRAADEPDGPHYHLLARAAAEAIGLKPGCVILASDSAEVEVLNIYSGRLRQIENMKLFPDDKINRTTLQAAITVAKLARAEAFRHHLAAAPTPQAD